MNTRQKLTLGIAAIFMVTLTIIGVTYAYFVTRVTGDNGTTTVDVSTANLASVEYVPGNASAGQTDLIQMSNIMPGEIVYKTFSVKNNSAAAAAFYDVFLQTAPVVSASTEGEYNVPFVHATETAKCYTDEAYGNRANLTDDCYDASTYNNILYSLYEVDETTYGTYNVTAVPTTTANDPASGLIGTAGQNVAHGATNASPQVILNDATIEAADDNDTAEDTSDDIPAVKYYVLKIEYKNVDGNQNIENKATLDIKLDIR